MTKQELIEKYKIKISEIDESVFEIRKLIKKGLNGDISVDIDDLEEEKEDAKSHARIYIQFIKDIEKLNKQQ